MATTEAERQKKYHDKMVDSNNVKVCVWLPADKREKLLKYATKLRKRK